LGLSTWQNALKNWFKRFIEGKEFVSFCGEVTAFLKPLAIYSTTKLQKTTSGLTQLAQPK